MDEQDWYFTFGANHTHPVTGQRLGNSYVVIHGTCDSTRDDMFAAFSNRWSMQYSSKEQARIDRYGMREVEMPAAPVEPPSVEERTGESQLVDDLREEYAQVEADQRTGVDEVLADLLSLRTLVTLYMPQFGDVRQISFAGLDRIEHFVRGEVR